ncbi:FAD/FMN-containing dehydrogenase [Agromyces terreus]|uniref:FAD/FMN-containing dehydrogenase n=1 Tax=Agromyces terreus TaxID=424795 RepID=A0A9X2GYJ5_9MICO|nr:FAD-binding protein [Agromyces terreus]MCP2369703.1 FAD/FMN-containing dehydrogenase [Agromyces terreus]
MTDDRTAALELLRTRLSGTLVLPGEPDYDAARSPWNLSVDQHPAAVVVPADVDEVRAVLATAAEAGLGVTTQPNGHGADDDLEGVVLIRPSAFDEITVDVEARVLRVGAGVNWGAALQALDGTGLIALAGSNPEVNVVGLAINGGHSMFSRRHGLTARSIVAVDLVDAAGGLRRVTDADDGELMWALRGGGGGFGVVTAIELALHEGSELFGGSLVFPVEAAVPVISAAFALARDVPELGLDIGMMQFPDLPVMPPHLRGRIVASIALVHVGDEMTGRGYADRLLAVAEPIANSLTTFTIGALAAVAGEPVDPMPTADLGAAIGADDDAFAAEFVEAFLAGAERGLLRCGLRAMGGATAEGQGAELAAVGAIRAPLLLSAGVLLMNPAIDPVAALQPLRALVERHGVHGGVPSMLGPGPLADAYGPAVLDRLAEVKQRVDPSGLVRGNRAIRAS